MIDQGINDMPEDAFQQWLSTQWLSTQGIDVENMIWGITREQLQKEAEENEKNWQESKYVTAVDPIQTDPNRQMGIESVQIYKAVEEQRKAIFGPGKDHQNVLNYDKLPYPKLVEEMSKNYLIKQAINTTKNFSPNPPVENNIYNTLEEIVTELVDIREYGILGDTIEKLERTIANGKYIQDGTK